MKTAGKTSQLPKKELSMDPFVTTASRMKTEEGAPQVTAIGGKYTKDMAKNLVLESFMNPRLRDIYQQSVNIAASTFSPDERYTLWLQRLEVQLAKDHTKLLLSSDEPYMMKEGRGEDVERCIKEACDAKSGEQLPIVQRRMEVLKLKQRMLDEANAKYQKAAQSLAVATRESRPSSIIKQPLFNVGQASSHLARLMNEADVEIYSNPRKEELLPAELKETRQNLEIKITGEQNRVLLNNIRPSFYRDKIEAPMLANYDEAIKATSTFLKPPMRQSLEGTRRMAPQSVTLSMRARQEEPEIVQKLKVAVGEEGFCRIRDLFEQYSALSGKLHYMDEYEFHKFMKENELHTANSPRIALDLLFFKNNRSKQIDFVRFLEILYRLAAMIYPDIHSEGIAIDELCSKYIFARRNVNYQASKSRFEDWFIELENPEVTEYLSSAKGLFLCRFKKYETNHPMFGMSIPLANFIKFCQATEIIPKMLSNPECSQMFKASQRKNSKTLHSQFLLYSEFVECLCFIAFLYFSKSPAPECTTYLAQIQYFISWLSKQNF